MASLPNCRSNASEDSPQWVCSHIPSTPDAASNGPASATAASPTARRSNQGAKPVGSPRRGGTVRLRVSSLSPGLELDLSRFRGLRLGEDEMKNAVLERSLDAISIDILREGEGSLVVAISVFVVNPLIAGMIFGRASSADRQHPPFEGDIHPVESDTRHLGEHDDAVTRFIDVGGRQEHRPRGRSLIGFCCLRRPLFDSSDFLGHSFALPRLMSRSTDLNLLRPVCFQPLKFDFQDAIVETGLDLIRIDPERQLDRARKRTVSALATLPIDILLLCGTPRSLQGQHVFLQVDRDVVPRHARQLTGAESARGVSPRAAHRSGLDTLASSGSCHRTKAAASRRELELLL